MDTAGGGARNTAPDGRLETTVALEAAPHSIAAARRLAVAFLHGARDEHLLPVSAKVVELTQLVVSELVTNAHKYAPGPALLRLRIITAALEVSVWDSHPHLPDILEADPARIGQHGLEIVAAIAQHLDIQPEQNGKRITARLALD
ncbi:ATP-binding protein [Streptomyces sp. NPDC005385]|uniref:ATP-binding protein n=1 Tax=Streptomyces sp. NPDC005385 TaxID=3157039 RepID=UPI0033B94A1B